MSDYQPFSGHDSTCPKCGGRLAMEYQSEGSVFRSSGVRMHMVGQSEWMLRSCIDCSYERPEMCRDAYPETAVHEP